MQPLTKRLNWPQIKKENKYIPELISADSPLEIAKESTEIEYGIGVFSKREKHKKTNKSNR